jgi:hypothetical protein
LLRVLQKFEVELKVALQICKVESGVDDQTSGKASVFNPEISFVLFIGAK